MSLEQLAEMMKGRPELDDHAKARAAERGRQPFHEAFLHEIYEPFWQGPLRVLSRAPGVSRVGHGSDSAPDLGVNFGKLALVISEDIFVETVVGVVVKISYIFAGDVNDGQLIRMPSATDAGARTLLTDHAKVWTGPIDRLLSGAEDDVDDVSGLLPKLLVEAVATRDARVAAEAKAAEEAAAAAKAAEEKAKKDEEERQEKMKTAALEAARAAEEEAAKAAAAPAQPEREEVVITPEDVGEPPAPKRKRGKPPE